MNFTGETMQPIKSIYEIARRAGVVPLLIALLLGAFVPSARAQEALAIQIGGVSQGMTVACGSAVSGTIIATSSYSGVVHANYFEAVAMMVSDASQTHLNPSVAIAPGQSVSFNFSVQIRPNIPPGPAQLHVQVNLAEGSPPQVWGTEVQIQVQCTPKQQ
jgi:hypothetical protein